MLSWNDDRILAMARRRRRGTSKSRVIIRYVLVGGGEVKKEEELGNIVAEECVSLKFCIRRLIAYIFE